MATKRKKNELFFVKEMPDDYIDYSQLKPISRREFERRLKASKKSVKPKKAA
jgi:hypothetical protein